MPSWEPDWRLMMAEAPELPLSGAQGYVYILADTHLGDTRADTLGFLESLESLPDARMVVFLGDLFKVWLAIPKYWDDQVRTVLEGFARLRAAGVRTVFVVGNREYFLPSDAATAARRGLPFDHIVPKACTLRWDLHRYGFAHGDLVNRADRQYLRWRRLSRSKPFEAVFRSMPAPLATRIAERLERSLSATNSEIKIQYPLGELEAFADTVLEGLEGFFIGHFHRDERIAPLSGPGFLRIVPDWFSRKAYVRLDGEGNCTTLHHKP